MIRNRGIGASSRHPRAPARVRSCRSRGNGHPVVGRTGWRGGDALSAAERRQRPGPACLGCTTMPDIRLPAGLTARPLHADDIDAVAALLEAAEAVDRTGEHFSAEDLAEWWVN